MLALSAGTDSAGIRVPGGLVSFLQGAGEGLPAFDAAKLEDLLERQLRLQKHQGWIRTFIS